jgi:hypothetical protein
LKLLNLAGNLKEILAKAGDYKKPLDIFINSSSIKEYESRNIGLRVNSRMGAQPEFPL